LRWRQQQEANPGGNLRARRYRRIHAVFHFQTPSHSQREAIWKVHTQHQGKGPTCRRELVPVKRLGR
jgi:hypothetical protein